MGKVLRPAMEHGAALAEIERVDGGSQEFDPLLLRVEEIDPEVRTSHCDDEARYSPAGPQVEHRTAGSLHCGQKHVGVTHMIAHRPRAECTESAGPFEHVEQWAVGG